MSKLTGDQLLTYRPKGMSFKAYKEKQKEQRNKVRQYLKGRFTHISFPPGFFLEMFASKEKIAPQIMDAYGVFIRNGGKGITLIKN